MNLLLNLLIILTPLITNCKNPRLTYWNLENTTTCYNKENIIYSSYHNQYFLKEMNQKRIGAYFNAKHGSFLIDFSRWGNYKFNQNISRVYFNKKLSPDLIMGIGLQGYLINQLEFRSSSIIIKPNFSTQYSVDKKNRIYASVHGDRFYDKANYYPEVISIGWTYEISNLVSSLLSIQQSLEKRFINLGLNIKPSSSADLFIEISNSEHPLSFSSLISKGKIDLMMSCKFHQKLGLSNQLGLGYRW